MCSLTLNKTFDEILKELKGDRQMIEKRLKRMAFDANVNMAGLLDAQDTYRKRQDDLVEVRKRQIGRHRVYFIGYHTQCSYTAIYIKGFKKTGVDDEDDENFKNKLRRALAVGDSRTLPDPKEQDDN